MGQFFDSIASFFSQSGFLAMTDWRTPVMLLISFILLFLAIVKKFEETIKHDTLAVDVVYGQDRDSYSDVNINGEVVKLDVEKV